MKVKGGETNILLWRRINLNFNVKPARTLFSLLSSENSIDLRRSLKEKFKRKKIYFENEKAFASKRKSNFPIKKHFKIRWQRSHEMCNEELCNLVINNFIRFARLLRAAREASAFKLISSMKFNYDRKFLSLGIRCLVIYSICNFLWTSSYFFFLLWKMPWGTQNFTICFLYVREKKSRRRCLVHAVAHDFWNFLSNAFSSKENFFFLGITSETVFLFDLQPKRVWNIRMRAWL